MNERPHRLSSAAQQRTRQQEHWKQSLRQACVNRARKNRKDLIWKKRQQQTAQEQQQQPTTTATPLHSNNSNDEVRSLVEQELRQQGVSVVTPGTCKQKSYSAAQDGASPDSSFEETIIGAPPSPGLLFPSSQQQQQQQQAEVPAHHNENQMQDNYLASDHFISEEELYELLEEVEDELQRSEEELLEEILEEERLQQEEMEQQVAQYEEWEDCVAMSDDDECVICPLCCEAMLRSNPDTTITCPNEACHFHLGPASSTKIVGLADLKERLRIAFENHTVGGCGGSLTFDILPLEDYSDSVDQNHGHLLGTCMECDTMLSLS